VVGHYVEPFGQSCRDSAPDVLVVGVAVEAHHRGGGVVTGFRDGDAEPVRGGYLRCHDGSLPREKQASTIDFFVPGWHAADHSREVVAWPTSSRYYGIWQRRALTWTTWSRCWNLRNGDGTPRRWAGRSRTRLPISLGR